MSELVPYIDDVAVRNKAISLDLAVRANLCATRLMSNYAELEFVREPEPNIYHVQVSDGDMPSIHRFPAEAYRNRSLLKAANTLFEYADGDCPDYVGIYHLEVEIESEPHQDRFSGGFTLLTLSGLRIVNFPHPTIENAGSNLMQTPGDLYCMKFRDDASSIWHSVDTFNPSNVLYVATLNP